MSRWDSNAAEVLDGSTAEVPILVGDGYEVFEGWGGFAPEQIAECEQAEADAASGRAAGVSHGDVLRVIAEMRAQQGE